MKIMICEVPTKEKRLLIIGRWIETPEVFWCWMVNIFNTNFIRRIIVDY